MVSTLENTKNLSFLVGLQHQDNTIVESVAKITSSTFFPIDFATRYISSVPNIIADNSFRGTVAFINLDFDATSEKLKVESFKDVALVPEPLALEREIPVLGTGVNLKCFSGYHEPPNAGQDGS